MRRSASIRFAAALAILLFAAWLWHRHAPAIDRPDAEARAARLLAAYIAQTGQPSAHFGTRRSFAGADGWDFVWVYRPCADAAELRITIALSGSANYAELPDCSARHGFWIRPGRA